ncbi:MAG: transmembrane anchor protein [Alteraurantiacibacter sp. bin_em_oilr2.035]|nr:transmembrane anchor protein [Alteraurantiacibacter sp. bin_em_oilr2.035]
MFNSQSPSTADLPTSGQLLRATGIAVVAAGAILVAVVLPAEYGIDPTGAGRTLGLTQMGEIKEQLALEAAADRAAAEGSVESDMPMIAEVTPQDTQQEAATDSRSDVTTLTLAPGEGAEIKVDLAEGTAVNYDWSVSGGTVNFDTHADAPGISYHGYGKGRNSPGEQGTLVAEFDGNHGWFWRNRSGGPVTITLRTDGPYTEIKRVV